MEYSKTLRFWLLLFSIVVVLILLNSWVGSLLTEFLVCLKWEGKVNLGSD